MKGLRIVGSVQGGGAACLNNPVCRGFQICWAYPVWGSAYQQSAVIRLKGGLGPLNTTAGLQNPYCSVYTIDNSIFDNSGGEGREYALRKAYNGTQAEAYYQYAVSHASTNATLSSVTASGDISNSTSYSVTNDKNNRRLLQDSKELNS